MLEFNMTAMWIVSVVVAIIALGAVIAAHKGWLK